MASVKRLVLDVLKPHHPNALEFATQLAERGSGYRVNVVVDEVDEKTESVIVEVAGAQIDYEDISAAIAAMGASIHSIDEVEVSGSADDTASA